MKRLIIVIIWATAGFLIGWFLVTPSVFGQDTENVYTPPMTGGSIQENEIWLTTSELAIKHFLTLYDQYKEACYNDSTEVTFGYFRSWDFCGEFKAVYEPRSDEISFNLIRTEQGYTHAEPTFTGFMEFIKEKQR